MARGRLAPTPAPRRPSLRLPRAAEGRSQPRRRRRADRAPWAPCREWANWRRRATRWGGALPPRQPRQPRQRQPRGPHPPDHRASARSLRPPRWPPNRARPSPRDPLRRAPLPPCRHRSLEPLPSQGSDRRPRRPSRPCRAAATAPSRTRSLTSARPSRRPPSPECRHRPRNSSSSSSNNNNSSSSNRRSRRPAGLRSKSRASSRLLPRRYARCFRRGRAQRQRRPSDEVV